MEQKTVATIYNPGTLSKSDLIDSFVVRLQKFDKIFGEIKSAKMVYPEQHLLIEGQRGMGKTTMLLRLAYAVENDSALNTWLIPIWLNEEQYGLRTLASLWEYVATHLEDKDARFEGLAAQMDAYYYTYKDDPTQFEALTFDLLIQALEREGKKLLLLMDNFGEMFLKLKSESKRLREILMTCSHIRIIGASSLITETFFRYDEPLYEFFRIERLSELNTQETQTLLLKLGSRYGQERIQRIVENEPERIEAFRRLSGGVVRTIVLLYEIFVDDETGSAFKDLEAVLDRVTPLYKHRMDDLCNEQQQIVDAIALNWEAMSPQEIAGRTRLSADVVADGLRVLTSNGILTRSEYDEQLYFLRERFFNIWYLMRNGRKNDKNRVLWLAHFLEAWLSPKEIRQRLNKFLQLYDSGRFSDDIKLYLVQAYTHPMLKSARYLVEALNDAQNPIAAAIASSDSLKKHIDITKCKFVNKYFSFDEGELKSLLATSCIRLETKIEFVRKFSGLSPQQYEEITHLLRSERQRILTDSQHLISPTVDACGQRLALATFLKDYLGYTEQGLIEYAGAVDEKCFDAFILGQFFVEAQDYNRAEKYLLQAWDEHENAEALFPLGELYENQFNDYQNAKIYYALAWEKTKIPKALFRWASVLIAVGEYKNAIEKYSEYISVGEWKGAAYCNIGWVYHTKLKQSATAEPYYTKAIEHGDSAAKRLLAALYMEIPNRFIEGETILRSLIDNGDADAMNTLAWEYYLIAHMPQRALQLAKQAYDVSPDIYKTHTYATILAWNNHIDQSVAIAKSFLIDPKTYDSFTEDVVDYLLLLMAKGAYSATHALFTDSELSKIDLKNRYAPVYYALLKLMQSDDFHRMSGGIAETVQEILASVEAKRKKYGLGVGQK